MWLTILSQLAFFINAHADELQSFFVSHRGQEQLEVISNASSTEDADFGAMVVHMTELMKKRIVDPELQSWILPDFSTTTVSDHVVAATLMMGGFQKYFSYRMTLRCGIPSVTLLGEKEDWEQLLHKLDRVPQLGIEPIKFATLVRPVLEGFIASFKDPTSSEVVSFWSKCTHETGGSGPHYLSGWITAFCFWNEEGQSLRTFQTPNIGQKLTFIKQCRFPSVELSEDGILTSGHLWQLTKIVKDARKTPSPPKGPDYHLNGYQRMRLCQLAEHLDSGGCDTAETIDDYISRRNVER